MGREYYCSEFDCEVCCMYGKGLCDLFSQHWALFTNNGTSFLVNDFGEVLESSEPAIISDKRAYIIYPLVVLQ
ncbi:hypothetical protein J4205_03380 [Candidatus Pacearchaeota archaeon]|nr:hypothetical protein [Candidatus Pacearchaeota archaeon]